MEIKKLAGPIAVDLSQECRDCYKCFEDSNILDVVKSVSWSSTDSFNLKSIVSCRSFFMRQEVQLCNIFNSPLRIADSTSWQLASWGCEKHILERAVQVHNV